MKLSHEESIHYAVEQYLAGTTADMSLPTTKEQQVEGLTDFEELNRLVNFDGEGNPIYETPEEEIEEDVQTLNDDEGAILGLVKGERIFCWMLLDTLLVDITGFPKEIANQIIQYVWQFQTPNGFYHVKLQVGETIVSAGFNVEDIDMVALTDYMKELNENAQVEAG